MAMSATLPPSIPTAGPTSRGSSATQILKDRDLGVVHQPYEVDAKMETPSNDYEAVPLRLSSCLGDAKFANYEVAQGNRKRSLLKRAVSSIPVKFGRNAKTSSSAKMGNQASPGIQNKHSRLPKVPNVSKQKATSRYVPWSSSTKGKPPVPRSPTRFARLPKLPRQTKGSDTSTYGTSPWHTSARTTKLTKGRNSMSNTSWDLFVDSCRGEGFFIGQHMSTSEYLVERNRVEEYVRATTQLDKEPRSLKAHRTPVSPRKPLRVSAVYTTTTPVAYVESHARMRTLGNDEFLLWNSAAEAELSKQSRCHKLRGFLESLGRKVSLYRPRSVLVDLSQARDSGDDCEDCDDGSDSDDSDDVYQDAVADPVSVWCGGEYNTEALHLTLDTVKTPLTTLRENNRKSSIMDPDDPYYDPYDPYDPSDPCDPCDPYSPVTVPSMVWAVDMDFSEVDLS